MAGQGRTFRLFVSSTFADMHAEREVLQRRVFPRLQRFCLDRGARFQAVDLRWGVSDEAALDQRTMPLCLDEIRRCQRTTPRPNFLVLLGQRYGWRPLLWEIPDDDFVRIEPLIADAGARKLLGDWYRLDENAVPVVHVLQGRTGRFEDAKVWADEVEEPLHEALERAVAALDWPEERSRRYLASATEQEIAEGALRADADHAFCCFRTKSDAEEEPSARLDDLKARLRARYGDKVLDYGGDDLDRLCDRVYEHLSDALAAELEQAGATNPLDDENEAHEEFGLDRGRGFLGRETTLERVREYLAAPGGSPLVLYGPSGCGKSALVAKCVEVAAEVLPTAARLTRFIGATPSSTDLRGLLTDLCSQLGRLYADPADIPLDMKELREDFARRLSLATADRPLVVMLDALDQLGAGDAAHSLNWLPVELPEHVRLIVSVLERDDAAGACWHVAGHKIGAEHQVEVPLLGADEGEALLRQWLDGARRKLTGEPEASGLSGFRATGLPLYLRLAFEEARQWRSYGGVPALSQDVPGVIRDLLKRLGHPAAHGEVMVRKALGYLGAARNGLADGEMLEVLSRDEIVMADVQRSPNHPKTDRLPPVVWSRLYFDLEPYLVERRADQTSLLGFYHRQFGEVVAEDYVQGDAATDLHRRLGEYFGEQPNLLGEGVANYRKASELVTQQVGGEDWDGVEATLTDFSFLEMKVEAGMVPDLVNDFDAAVGSLPRERPFAEPLKLVEGALRLSEHILAQDPEQLPSQLFGRLVGFEDPAIRLFLENVKGSVARPWVRPESMSLTPPGEPLLRTLTGHTGWVLALALTLDGRRAISASRDHTLKVWDLESGAELRTLAGHTEWVQAVAVRSDGRQAISASADRTLKVWDLESGTEVHTLTGHTWSVDAVAVTPDGSRAISGSHDKTLKMWDLESGSEVRTLTGHAHYVRAVAVTPDGRRAISGDSHGTLKVWDLESGTEVRTLTGHASDVDAVAVTPDGRQAISASEDQTLKVWDLESGTKLRTLTGHTGPVQAVAVTPDGRRVISGSWYHAVTVWDLESGEELRALTGHTAPVHAVAVTPDGRWALSGSGDNTLKVWDLECREEMRNVTGHTGWVAAVAVTPDGRQAISAAGGPMGNYDCTLKLWDLESGGELRALTGHTREIQAVAVTPDGRRAISASRDMTLRVWDLERGEELLTLTGHTYHVDAVAVSPAGRWVISASGGDQTLKVWDLESGAELRTLPVHIAPFAAVALTPDGRRAICGSWYYAVTVCDLASGAELYTLNGHDNLVTAVAVTPDGRRAISGSEDKTLKVWDLENRVVLRTLTGHTDSVRAVAVTPDGRQAISGSSDGTLKVWNLESGVELRTLSGSGPIAITPDGRLAISVSRDETLMVWDLRTWVLLCTFRAEANVSCCAVAPNGRLIVAGDGKGHVHCLHLENVPPAPPILSAWLAPDGSLAFSCLLCRVWSEVPSSTLGTELPCPHCGNPVKLNPFTIDAAWRPIARAWRPAP